MAEGLELVMIEARVSCKAVMSSTMANGSLARSLTIEPRIRIPIAKGAWLFATWQRILRSSVMLRANIS